MANKPIIETMINTAALAITAFGTNLLIQKEWWGFLLITFGMVLEFIKYYGRKCNLWE